MSNNKNLNLLITIVVCSLLISCSIIFLGIQLANSNSSDGLTVDTNRNDDIAEYTTTATADTEHDDAVLGNTDALITIVEYSDYQCPFCRSFFTGAYEQVKTNYIETGKAKYIFKDFPLEFHKDAIYAANAAECARAQTDDETYFAFHDGIFQEQGPVSNMTVSITDEMITKIAKNLKVNNSEFRKCLANKTYYPEVAGDLMAAELATAERIAEYNFDTKQIEIRPVTDDERVGVTATPTFFVNDIKIVGAQPYEVFKYAIDTELSRLEN